MWVSTSWFNRKCNWIIHDAFSEALSVLWLPFRIKYHRIHSFALQLYSALAFDDEPWLFSSPQKLGRNAICKSKWMAVVVSLWHFGDIKLSPPLPPPPSAPRLHRVGCLFVFRVFYILCAVASSFPCEWWRYSGNKIGTCLIVDPPHFFLQRADERKNSAYHMDSYVMK